MSEKKEAPKEKWGQIKDKLKELLCTQDSDINCPDCINNPKDCPIEFISNVITQQRREAVKEFYKEILGKHIDKLPAEAKEKLNYFLVFNSDLKQALAKI